MTAKSDNMSPIVPVILSGGAGTRLWPLSRSLRPKQFLTLTGGVSLFAATVERASEGPFGEPIVVGNDEHRFLIAEEMRRHGCAWRAIILEPLGRNTAPAIAAAAVCLSREDPAAVMAVLPSDHTIEDTEIFRTAVTEAARLAVAGHLVTFGIPPTGPETAYGYICRGRPIEGADNAYQVDAFTEKPDVDAASAYLASGDYYWNSGMFVMSAAKYLEELQRFHPQILDRCSRAVDGAATDLDFLRLDEPSFAEAEAISVDYAVMEKTDSAAMIPLDTAWSDVGSWSALSEIAGTTPDDNGNITLGPAVTVNAQGNYVRSEKPLVAAVGVENLVVVATDDAVLVVPKDRAQDVRGAVEKLRDIGRGEVTSHSRIYRPWGYYQNLDHGDGFLVKQIVVNPGAKLSLQKHARRAEHWVVVDGVARVTNGEREFDLQKNESTFIPLGVTHRLENQGTEPLRLIEVQSGDYIGEDDIVRMEDDYGRG